MIEIAKYSSTEILLSIVVKDITKRATNVALL